MSYFGYSKWEDVGLEYNSIEYQWVVIQTRTRNRDNKRYFRKAIIQNYGIINSQTQERIREIINNKSNK